MAGLKQWAKKGLQEWQRRKYDRLMEEKAVSYDSWIRGREKEKYGPDSQTHGERALSVRQVSYEICRDYVGKGVMHRESAAVVLFVGEGGNVSEIAERVTAEYFWEHKEIDLAYGDEDVMGPDGIRYTPWLKPHWSPDTFLSFFYFGSIFAVRTEALCALTEDEKKWILAGGKNGRAYGGNDAGENSGSFAAGDETVYRLCYVAAAKSGGFLPRDGKAADGRNGDGFGFPVGHMDEVLFHARHNLEMEFAGSKSLDGTGCPATEAGDAFGKNTAGNGLMSVVIPSKDNPEVLKRCIESVQKQCSLNRQREGMRECEIIVVDNGSAEEVRKDLEGWLAGRGCLYLYEKMPFHFSKMCNIGAAASQGDVLLFLNDDTEIVEDSEKEESRNSRPGMQGCLLERLYGKAKRGFTGAAGVKLYYPDSRRIQHAGIVNLRLGPVHKLQFRDDGTDFFYGWNRRERNVIAVTGACLAVERKKYKEAGGFPEELPIAFNDVDFCFTLFEKGYYNVVLQDAVLYHYESMSRGNDDDRQKLERLLGEREKLYGRHPHLYGMDPFYHKYLAGDMLSTGFELKADYDVDPQYGGVVRRVDGLETNGREDACVMVSLEYAGPWEQSETDWGEDRDGGKGRGYLLQGYSFVAGSDNACFDKYLIFGEERECTGAEKTERTAGEGNGNRGAGSGKEAEGADGRDGNRNGKAGSAERKVQGNGYRVWAVKAEPYIRKDVETNLPDQKNVGMTGFCMEIGREDLPAGIFRVGVMAREKGSGQKLYSWTNRYLVVKG